MDQGIAAVLGAAVGAVSTGGASVLAARSASILHKRQSRREAYLGYLRHANAVTRLMVHLKKMFEQDLIQETRNADAVQAALDDLRGRIRAAAEATTPLQLAGPDRLLAHARQALLPMDAAYYLIGDHWCATYMSSPLPAPELDRFEQVYSQTIDELAHFSVLARKKV